MKQQEGQQQQQEQQQPKNGTQPVSDDELEAVTGGGWDVDYFNQYTRLCPHCLSSILKNMYEAHVEQCPKNPKNKK